MKATEFCYWLQGLFELADPHTLTKQQVECISKHLALTEALARDDSPAAVRQFTAWLRVSMDWLDGSVPEQVLKVRTKLAECFAHAIDKQYGPDAHLDVIHDGQPPHLRPVDPDARIRPRC